MSSVNEIFLRTMEREHKLNTYTPPFKPVKNPSTFGNQKEHRVAAAEKRAQKIGAVYLEEDNILVLPRMQ
jgi:hypothetical protein